MNIIDLINKFDTSNQFDVLNNYYLQIEFISMQIIDLSSLKDKKIENIILSGLGGSAIAGDLLSNFLKDDLKVPFVINRNYSLPGFANENTLVIISSYSGNTEETIEVLNNAIEKKCLIVCVTTGGVVKNIAKQKKLSIVCLQEGFQPRFSLSLSFFALIRILQEISLIDNHDKLISKIKNNFKNSAMEFSKKNNFALNIAESLIGFIPIIYSVADVTNSVGYRFKCQLNENSKVIAFHNVFPELNHNEIVGWESYFENQLRTKLICIWDDSYHPQIKKRIEITNEIISNCKVDIITLSSNKKTFKERLLDLIYQVDWISYYLSILREKDPREIDNINLLKERLK